MFGILLLAYGGPDSLDDIPAFLHEVRGGQSVPPSVIDETTRRYRLIGGRSPLLDITRRVAARLQEEIKTPVYVGMRHWHPYIADTVNQMARDGVTRAVAICLAPHYSALSIGAYRAKLKEALGSLRGAHPERTLSERSESKRESQDCATKQSPNCALEIASQRPLAMTAPIFDFVESWHTQPHYIAGIARNVQETLARFPADARPRVIFTAHSLPATAREPYEAQLRETARLVAQRLGLGDEHWTLCYQSKPRVDGAWLGPQIEDLVPQLARDGERALLIAPIGFVAEHVEILYDLDIALPEIARAHGVHIERAPMLNDSPAHIAALAELARGVCSSLRSETE